MLKVRDDLIVKTLHNVAKIRIVTSYISTGNTKLNFKVI